MSGLRGAQRDLLHLNLSLILTDSFHIFHSRVPGIVDIVTLRWCSVCHGPLCGRRATSSDTLVIDVVAALSDHKASMEEAREKASEYPSQLWLLCHAPRSAKGDEEAIRAAVEGALDSRIVEKARDGASWANLCELFSLFVDGVIGVEHVYIKD